MKLICNSHGIGTCLILVIHWYENQSIKLISARWSPGNLRAALQISILVAAVCVCFFFFFFTTTIRCCSFSAAKLFVSICLFYSSMPSSQDQQIRHVTAVSMLKTFISADLFIWILATSPVYFLNILYKLFLLQIVTAKQALTGNTAISHYLFILIRLLPSHPKPELFCATRLFHCLLSSLAIPMASAVLCCY